MRPNSETVVQLDWTDLNGSVVVTPRNQDRYLLKVNKAVELLHLGGQVERFNLELKVLFSKLANWLREASSVRSAFLTLRDGGLLFVVVRDSAAYDEDFEDSLTDLDIAIASDADLSRMRLDVLSLPLASEEALATFMDREFVWSFESSVPSAS